MQQSCTIGGRDGDILNIHAEILGRVQRSDTRRPHLEDWPEGMEEVEEAEERMDEVRERRNVQQKESESSVSAAGDIGVIDRSKNVG